MDEKQFKQLIKVLEEIKASEESISKKLNILISPLFRRDKKWQDKEITRASIKRLTDCGLDYLAISEILDLSRGTVANELTYLKNKSKKKNGRKKSR